MQASQILSIGICATGVFFSSPHVLAQALAASSEALFEKGVSEFHAEQYASACPKIAESFRLDPRPGTAFVAGECELRRGHIASASVWFHDYLRLAESLPANKRAAHQDRVEYAQKQRETLAKDIPEVTISSALPLPSGTLVSCDGVALSEPSLNVALPLDPGAHLLRIRIAGKPESAQSFELAKGERKTVFLRLPEFADQGAVKTLPSQTTTQSEPLRSSSSPAPLSKVPAPRPILAEPADAPIDNYAQRYKIYGIATFGVSSVVAGLVLGGLTLQKRSEANSQCDLDTGACGAQDSVWTGRSAISLAEASTLAVSVGVVATAASLALWFFEKKKSGAEHGKTQKNALMLRF